MRTPTHSLRPLALEHLLIVDARAKCAAVRAADWSGAPVDAAARIVCLETLPGRAHLPVLVSPHRVPQRSCTTRQGRAALIHALAHIESNAVNLALDIAWRFADLPIPFYRDWIGVAREEALHFEWLDAHLATLGHRYGDFPAHNGLWDVAEKTRDDVLARLALVPRVMEARGLDVSPGIRDKLLQAGDHAGAAILTRILEDEVGHVAIGNRWFHALCKARGIEPESFEARERAARDGPVPKGPFNREARLRAGFTDREIAALERAQK
ncbi:MAG: ferritin-like domain-containing protein [Betaproteobacteria bacterium]|nr:ferritin-like domain-containing protein [Betaproteobacteria bacterium]